jgi:hypothetical protein
MQKHGMIGPDTPDLDAPAPLGHKQAAAQPKKTADELDQQDQHKRDSDRVKEQLKNAK